MDDAVDFLRALPVKARDKIAYNIRRVERGERDNELFKKLEGSEIWEFRTLYFRTAYRLFAFWDRKRKHWLLPHMVSSKSHKKLQVRK
jgi:phage-related protein